MSYAAFVHLQWLTRLGSAGLFELALPYELSDYSQDKLFPF